MAQKQEILSFIYQQRYLARKMVKNESDVQKIKRYLSKKYKIPINKITEHHDLG